MSRDLSRAVVVALVEARRASSDATWALDRLAWCLVLRCREGARA